MDTVTLTHILREEMRGYAGEGLNAKSYLTVSEDETVYAVIDMAHIREKRIISAVLVARIVDDHIYIDVDRNSHLLVDALLARGVPEQQIVLAYRDDSRSA